MCLHMQSTKKYTQKKARTAISKNKICLWEFSGPNKKNVYLYHIVWFNAETVKRGEIEEMHRKCVVAVQLHSFFD